MSARARFVLALGGGMLVMHGAAAQEEPAEPPSEPPVASPEPSPAPAEPTPPADAPSSAPSPAPPSTAAFPTEAPPPVLAPLPPSDASAPPPVPNVAPATPAPVVVPAPPAASPGATQNPPLADARKPPDESTEISKDGLFGPFRIGVLVGAGLPSFLSFAGEIRLTRYFGAGVRFGLIPNLHFSYYGKASVSYQDYGVYAHLHPFGGGFLLGAELGYAHATGSYASSLDTSQFAALGAPSSVDINTTGSVQTLIATPEIGYVYTWRAGFTFGFDFGAQIPIAPSHVALQDHVAAAGIPQSFINGYLNPDQERVRSTLEKVGQTVLPAFHLRIGWLL